MDMEDSNLIPRSFGIVFMELPTCIAEALVDQPPLGSDLILWLVGDVA